MRTAQEITRAHDMLASVLLGRPPLALDAEEKLAMTKLYEALCWALDHDWPSNRNFQTTLAEIDRIAREHGWVRDEPPKIKFENSRN